MYAFLFVAIERKAHRYYAKKSAQVLHASNACQSVSARIRNLVGSFAVNWWAFQ